jgi:hypothetical protein
MQLESNIFWICSWWTRGWTLQELLAPKIVEFYDRDWVRRGTKSELSNEIHEFTGIDLNILLTGTIGELSTIPVAKRMSWAANRSTTRQEELAYCLLGIFNVNMPLLYGEGQNAFIRLQEEIIKETNDLTLFAWVKNSSVMPQQQTHGILATSPADFIDAGNLMTGDSLKFGNDFAMTNKDLRFVSGLSAEGNRKVLILNAATKTAITKSAFILHNTEQVYTYGTALTVLHLTRSGTSY